MGKPLPPNVGFFHTAPPMGRRRKTSKSKLKAGKLLNPLVQQLKVVASSTGLPLLWEDCTWLRRDGAGGPQVSLRGWLWVGIVSPDLKECGVFFFLDLLILELGVSARPGKPPASAPVPIERPV